MRGEFPETLCIEQGVVLLAELPSRRVGFIVCFGRQSWVSQCQDQAARRSASSQCEGTISYHYQPSRTIPLFERV